MEQKEIDNKERSEYIDLFEQIIKHKAKIAHILACDCVIWLGFKKEEDFKTFLRFKHKEAYFSTDEQYWLLEIIVDYQEFKTEEAK